MTRIIITGPESSGKSTISKELSNYFNFPLIEEYARTYLKKIERGYDIHDLVKIAKTQYKLEKKHKDYVICDTDLITIKIWSEYKYQICDQWILNQIYMQKNEDRIYLLCYPDIEWKEDPLRENPNNRIELFNLFKTELNELNHNFFIIKGTNRLAKSKKILKNLIK